LAGNAKLNCIIVKPIHADTAPGRQIPLRCRITIRTLRTRAIGTIQARIMTGQTGLDHRVLLICPPNTNTLLLDRQRPQIRRATRQTIPTGITRQTRDRTLRTTLTHPIIIVPWLTRTRNGHPRHRIASRTCRRIRTRQTVKGALRTGRRAILEVFGLARAHFGRFLAEFAGVAEEAGQVVLAGQAFVVAGCAELLRG
jgi:hypothetical protein